MRKGPAPCRKRLPTPNPRSVNPLPLSVRMARMQIRQVRSGSMGGASRSRPSPRGARPSWTRRCCASQHEDKTRGSDPDQRRAARQSQSRPLVDVFFTWLPAQAARVSRNSELGEAMAYMLRREEGFRLFLDNGRRLQRFQPGRSQRKKCFSSKLHCGPAPQCIKDIGSRRRFRCIRGATFPQIR